MVDAVLGEELERLLHHRRPRRSGEQPRYASVNDRHTHMGELLSAIREAVPSRTTRE